MSSQSLSRLVGWAALVCVAAAAPLPAQQTAEVRPAVEDYVIGPGDLLWVGVWGEDLTMEVMVRPDGKISFPLVNDVTVSGLTPSEVRNLLAKRLGEFLRDPNVTVIVKEINNFRVFVLGEVNTQGVLTFHRPTRVLEAIAEAGGLSEFSKKEIVVLRADKDGRQERIVVDYKKIVAGGNVQGNIQLVPGDTLIVN